MKENTYTLTRSSNCMDCIVPNGFEEIIEELIDKQIFGFEPREDGKIYMRELCDDWFFMELTKEKCIELSNMFKFISENI